MVSTGKRLIAERWFNEYFTKGNLEVIAELTTEDFVYHSRNGGNSRDTMVDFMNGTDPCSMMMSGY